MAFHIETRLGACEAGPLGTLLHLAQPRHILHRNLNPQLQLLGARLGFTIVTGR